MKKIFLTIAASCAITGASYAAVSTPEFFSQDFLEMSAENDHPVDGWLTLGNNAAVQELDSEYFKPEGPYYTIINYGSMSIPFATTDFTDGSSADQWLISPEIEVPYDDATLYFEVCAYTAKGMLGDGNSDRHPYKVMVSEGGTEKSEFKTILSNEIVENATKEVTTQVRAVGFTGYKGKKIRVAFVAEGSNIGWTGFTNIHLGQYILQINDNLTPEIVSIGDTPNVDYNFKIKAPVTCPSVSATLEVNGKTVDTKQVKKAFGSSTSYSLQIARFTFNRVTTITDKSGATYTLTVTPDFEGAVPTVITGSLNVAQFNYPSNVVVEEGTATGCQFCPRGIAAMEYYHDTYKGEDGKGKVIGIALHGYMNYFDPMSTGVDDYLAKIKALNRVTGLPQAIYNRATRGAWEIDKSQVETLLAQTSYNTASINKVEVPLANEIYDLYGKTVKVNFSVKNGYDSADRNIAAAVVLIENNVKGNDSGYKQENNYYNMDASSFLSTYRGYGAGEWIIPYMTKFLSGGELGDFEISFSKMTYQHVARGIFPSFFGMSLRDAWVADENRTFDLEFKFPDNVMDLDNTEAVLLITDADTNRIVASDIMPASAFLRYEDSGVSNVALPGVSICKSNGFLHIDAPQGSEAQIYNIDGVALGSYTVNGSIELNLASKGVVVVRVSTPDGVQTSKLTF